MNKHVAPNVIAMPRGTMSRRQKLLHLARVVRAHPLPLTIHTGLDQIPKHQLRAVATFFPAYGANGETVFSLAKADKTFRAEGLSRTAHIGEILDFLGIVGAEIYTFTVQGPRACISSRTMSERIAMLA